MGIVKIDRALAARFPTEARCDGVTVHACLDQVGRRWGMEFVDLCLDHVPGENWKLSDRVVVLLNGTDVRQQDGLSSPVALNDVLEVKPAHGF